LEAILSLGVYIKGMSGFLILNMEANSGGDLNLEADFRGDFQCGGEFRGGLLGRVTLSI
jgi:hypothetical protein